MAQASANETTDTTAEPQTADALFGAVYERLKLMARRRIRPNQRSVTLETTSVVHDLYLRMSREGDLSFQHPSQFFTYAARAMRHLLSDRARDHLTRRAGGDWVRVTLTGSNDRLVLEGAEQAIALDGALDRLEKVDERSARVVELRYFAGLTSEETAAALGVSKRTADRDWEFAQAFLKTDLG